MEKTSFDACHLLRFSLDAALNSKKNNVIVYCSYSCLCRLIIIIHFDFNIDNYIFECIMIGYLFTCMDNEKHENLLVYSTPIWNCFQSLENILLNDILLFLSCFLIHVNLVIWFRKIWIWLSSRGRLKTQLNNDNLKHILIKQINLVITFSCLTRSKIIWNIKWIVFIF